HVDQSRRGLQPLQVLAQAEHGRTRAGRVAADALEHAGAVVEPVRADVDAGVGPVDELAVEPDLLGLLHPQEMLVVGGDIQRHRPREAHEPARTQTRSCARSLRSRKTRSTFGSGNGHTAPGAKPVSSSTSSGEATRARRAEAAAATLRATARRSPGTMATTGRPSQRKTTDLTIWSSLQPTAPAAACAVGVPAGNSSSRTSAPVSRR